MTVSVWHHCTTLTMYVLSFLVTPSCGKKRMAIVFNLIRRKCTCFCFVFRLRSLFYCMFSMIICVISYLSSFSMTTAFCVHEQGSVPARGEPMRESVTVKDVRTSWHLPYVGWRKTILLSMSPLAKELTLRFDEWQEVTGKVHYAKIYKSQIFHHPLYPLTNIFFRR